MTATPTTSGPPPPGPGDAVPSPHQRRIYFEHLTSLLLASGFSGKRVGRLVAELDDHVTLAGIDPVHELGPVGELAGALKAATDPRRQVVMVGVHLALGAAVGLALGAVIGLLTGRGDGAVELPLAPVAQVTATSTGIILLRSFGSRSLQGRRTFELPGWRPSGLYLLGVITLVALTAGRVWVMPPAAAVAIAVVASAGSGLSLWWLMRFQRVRVPGAAGHLGRLHWGWLGR